MEDVPISITASSGDLPDRATVIELDVWSDITAGQVIQEQSTNHPGVVILGVTADSGLAQASRATSPSCP